MHCEIYIIATSTHTSKEGQKSPWTCPSDMDLLWRNPWVFSTILVQREVLPCHFHDAHAQDCSFQHFLFPTRVSFQGDHIPFPLGLPLLVISGSGIMTRVTIDQRNLAALFNLTWSRDLPCRHSYWHLDKVEPSRGSYQGVWTHLNNCSVEKSAQSWHSGHFTGFS